MREPRPAITIIGEASDDGENVVVKGWGISECARRCRCHRNPEGKLEILEDRVRGRLGLWSRMGEGCSCCQPWTYAELILITAFLEFTQRESLPEGGA